MAHNKTNKSNLNIELFFLYSARQKTFNHDTQANEYQLALFARYIFTIYLFQLNSTQPTIFLFVFIEPTHKYRIFLDLACVSHCCYLLYYIDDVVLCRAQT